MLLTKDLADELYLLCCQKQIHERSYMAEARLGYGKTYPRTQKVLHACWLS